MWSGAGDRPQGDGVSLAVEIDDVEYASADGLRVIEGEVPRKNVVMTEMYRELRFVIRRSGRNR